MESNTSCVPVSLPLASKKALSGFAQERVDTRVMQIIYKVNSTFSNLFVGQQVDLFISSDALSSSASAKQDAHPTTAVEPDSH